MIATARALAEMLGAQLSAVHVRGDGDRTARSAADAAAVPLQIVPPDASVPETFRRVLVPLEGAPSTAPTPASIFELSGASTIDVVALHVVHEDSIPAFTDQPQHEHSAWAREFLARYCPEGLEGVRLETRVGRTDELVAVVAEQCGCDLIALGWSQELAPGRAPVVRATLQRSRLPVILVPVNLNADFAEDVVLANNAESAVIV